MMLSLMMLDDSRKDGQSSLPFGLRMTLLQDATHKHTEMAGKYSLAGRFTMQTRKYEREKAGSLKENIQLGIVKAHYFRMACKMRNNVNAKKFFKNNPFRAFRPLPH